MVKHLVGESGKFIFSQVSDKLPKVDLSDLQPFFEGALVLNGRRPDKQEHGIGFIVPDVWKDSCFGHSRMEAMTFDRNDKSTDAYKKLLGMGHKLFDKAVDMSLNTEAVVASLPSSLLPNTIAIFKVYDRVTTNQANNRFVLVGVECSDGGFKLLLDWQLLTMLNKLPLNKESMLKESAAVPVQQGLIDHAQTYLSDNLAKLEHGFKVPDMELFAALVADISRVTIHTT
jgi:hypothetical protein